VRNEISSTNRSLVTPAGGKLIRKGERAPGVPYAYVCDPDGRVIET